MNLTFKPFNKETTEDIRPWFSDPDTKKWLGDSSWVDMELKQQSESIGTEFRGSKTIARCVSENSCLIAGILSLHCILEASFYT